jgi:hypothetical protein
MPYGLLLQVGALAKLAEAAGMLSCIQSSTLHSVHVMPWQQRQRGSAHKTYVRFVWAQCLVGPEGSFWTFSIPF